MSSLIYVGEKRHLISTSWDRRLALQDESLPDEGKIIKEQRSYEKGKGKATHEVDQKNKMREKRIASEKAKVEDAKVTEKTAGGKLKALKEESKKAAEATKKIEAAEKKLDKEKADVIKDESKVDAKKEEVTDVKKQEPKDEKEAKEEAEEKAKKPASQQ